MGSKAELEAFKNNICKLTGGAKAVLFNSGMNAIIQTILTLARAGDEVVVGANVRATAYNFFKFLLKDIGITANFVFSSDPLEFEAAVSPATRCIFIDLEGSMRPEAVDIKKIAEVAHRAKLPLVVDNGGIPMSCINPFNFGADIAILDFSFLFADPSYSGGMVIERGKIDWRIFNVPLLKAGDSCCHGIRWAFDMSAEDSAIAFSWRLETVMKSIFDSNIEKNFAGIITVNIDEAIKNYKTRFENAAKIAEFLNSSDKIGWVEFPALKSSSSYEFFTDQKYCGAYISFAIRSDKDDYDAKAKALCDSLDIEKCHKKTYSNKTLINYYQGFGHASYKDEYYSNPDMSEDLFGMFRIFPGIEDPDLIIKKLSDALDRI
jgi:O-acetylhomoserine (thiol)-lyase